MRPRVRAHSKSWISKTCHFLTTFFRLRHVDGDLDCHCLWDLHNLLLAFDTPKRPKPKDICSICGICISFFMISHDSRRSLMQDLRNMDNLLHCPQAPLGHVLVLGDASQHVNSIEVRPGALATYCTTGTGTCSTHEKMLLGKLNSISNMAHGLAEPKCTYALHGLHRSLVGALQVCQPGEQAPATLSGVAVKQSFSDP